MYQIIVCTCVCTKIVKGFSTGDGCYSGIYIEQTTPAEEAQYIVDTSLAGPSLQPGPDLRV